MPRHNPRQPVFPSDDGAFVSTGRVDISQTRTANNTTVTTPSTGSHQQHIGRRIGIGAVGGQGRGLGHSVAGRGPAVNAGNRGFRDAEEVLEGMDEEEFDEDGDSGLDNEEEEELEEDDEEGAEEGDEDYEMMDDRTFPPYGFCHFPTMYQMGIAYLHYWERRNRKAYLCPYPA